MDEMEKIERTLDMANALIETKGTLRSVADLFETNRQTVLNYLTNILPDIDPDLAEETRRILDKNKKERSKRGGQAKKKINMLHRNRR
jgi:putative DeoR family transcriptional regulator (stage III sporulation protein D)